MMGFVVKPDFTTLLQNQDLSLEAKKAEKKFFGETQFHNIDAKPGFDVGSKKSRGRGFVGETQFHKRRFCGETQFHNIDAKPGFDVGSKKSR